MYIAAIIIILSILVIAELVARFVFGLGDPPLLMPDEEIEYLPVPSKAYRRFGNQIAYNRWSMRSDDFPLEKSDPREWRILVLGDSVVNGGARVDQTEICTALIQRELAASRNRPVVVGNIACNSWGPPNLLAYVKRFGLFNADVAVIVLSSHDAADVPTAGSLRNDARRKPLLALQELVQKAVTRVRSKIAARKARSTANELNPAHVEWSMGSLRALINTCRDGGLRIVVCQHLERGEQLQLKPGYLIIKNVIEEMAVSRVEFGPSFAEALRRGEHPYIDSIHPSAAGHKLMAASIVEALCQIT